MDDTDDSTRQIKRVLRDGETEDCLTTNAYEDVDLPGYGDD